MNICLFSIKMPILVKIRPMYKYVLNLVIKISLVFAQYFEYYAIILRGAVFLWTQCISNNLKYTIRTLLWYSNIPHTVQAIDCKWLVSSAMNQTVQNMFFGVYCKTLNVSVPFISRISRAKQNRKTKGSKYQLQAKIGRNYYSISNCMVLIRQNNFAC